MKSINFILRLGLSVFLLGFLLVQINGEELFKLIASANGYFLSIAVFLVFVEVLLLVYAWFLIIIMKGHHVSYWFLWSIYVIGHFFGTFLPVNLGPDIVRTYSLSKSISNGADAVSSMAMLRIGGFLSVFGLVLGTPIFVGTGYVGNPLLAFLCATFLGLVTVLVAIHYFPGIEMWFMEGKNGRLSKISSFIGRLYLSFRHSISHPKIMGSSVGLMLVVQFLRIFKAYVIGLALVPDIAFHWFFVFVPLVVLIIQLPISFSGFGVREAAYVYFFTQAGIEVHTAFAMALFESALGLVFNVSGGVIYLIKNMRELGRESITG